MINFTVKGKNFPSGAFYWLPGVYYYENAEAKSLFLPAKIPFRQTAHFTNAPVNAGFWVGILNAAGDAIIGPYALATTDLFVLENGGQYILDFHQEVGTPTLSEEEAPAVSFIQNLWPWPPWAGPPLPRFFPPWPWWEWETGIPEIF